MTYRCDTCEGNVLASRIEDKMVRKNVEQRLRRQYQVKSRMAKIKYV